MKKIQMVDLKSQYQNMKTSIDTVIEEVLYSGYFIKGPAVSQFEHSLGQYLNVAHVITCANGTDALQIALMSLDLQEGDEVIIPSFTYVSVAEVICLLRLKPILIDVEETTFNIDPSLIEEVITAQTRVIIPVHLFGQCADMETVMTIAEKNNLYVIEDNAQSIGTDCLYQDGHNAKSGTIGHIGCNSFFPTKNLGCYGDGGAITTNDDGLAQRMRRIASHGQIKKYYHEEVGVNSRLDTIQAAVLNVKMNLLNDYIDNRRSAANMYDELLEDIPHIKLPHRAKYCNHTFNQYTIRVKDNKRDQLKAHLSSKDIPAMIYYPLPLHRQKAYGGYWINKNALKMSDQLCEEVLSLPMHTELDRDQMEYICDTITSFYK